MDRRTWDRRTWDWSSRAGGLAAALLFSLAFAVPAEAQAVKKSRSGICHARGTTYYARTTNFTPYPSVAACLASGGRLPAVGRAGSGASGSASSRGSGSSAARSANGIGGVPGYRRDEFGSGWRDADGDCQDGRAEALIATSTTPVTFRDARRCVVGRGRWISLFTGSVIQNSAQIDIDHLVPLKWAWDRGAARWTRARREAFANDLVNLLPVEPSLNRQKGARGPDEWLPPRNHCQYVARFVRVVRTYDLRPSPSEEAAYRRLLDNC